MTLPEAVRLTEILLSFALIQQSLEHMRGLPDERPHYLLRLGLSVLLLVGVQRIGIPPAVVPSALLLNALMILRRFQGPYNGGSDLLSLLLIFCLCLTHMMPTEGWKEVVFAYLALQAVFSYFKSGWAKVIHRDWRTGRALRDVFLFSTYPVSEATRGWADRPTLLRAMSWAVILFELAFPLALFSREALIAALAVGVAFHVANFTLFGFNRFVWIWIASYPSLFWLQGRFFLGD